MSVKRTELPAANWNEVLGIATGYHGSLDQQQSVQAAMAEALRSGESCLLRGPFRVGKSTVLLELVEMFGGEFDYMVPSDDWREYLRPGFVFLDEAGSAPPEFWASIPAETVLCAILPDVAPAPKNWKGRIFRLDAHCDCPCRQTNQSRTAE